MKKVFLILSVLAMAACDRCPDITGRWVAPVHGMENMTDGFELRAGGVAESINMATLVYDAWRRPECDTLVMTGKSVGNHQTIDFSETYHISMPDKDTMVLTTENGYTRTYTRE